MNFVGTSGYSYKQWRGSFYPEKLPEAEFLPIYASRLSAVEVNNTFYRMPAESVVGNWAAQVPAEFRFAIKASRRITHMGRLKNVEQPVDFLLERVGALGERLGCVLFQLPPNLRRDDERLTTLLSHVEGRVRVALEFRHASWFDDVVFDALREHNAALCIGDPDEGAPRPPLRTTADFSYVRLRKQAYTGTEIREWSQRLLDLDAQECFVFFKHEELGPSYATQLSAL